MAAFTPVKITVYGRPVILTAETIAATCEHFAQICDRCAEKAAAGAFHVNDLPRYLARKRDLATEYRAGPPKRLSATFVQRAYWLQSGESVGLLAPAETKAPA